MKTMLKSIKIVSVGFIIFTLLMYLIIAFYKAEINPFQWTPLNRGVLAYASFSYLCLSPVIIGLINAELKEKK